MLESMAERSVTVDGVTHPLPEPYFVLATQNPLESAGTYALPEAQLDRFLFKLLIEHPSKAVEEQLLRNVRDGFDAADLDAAQLQQILTVEHFRAMQAVVETVQVDDKIISYIAELVGNTRRHRAVQIGASPRAAIALLKTGRVEAAVQGRNFVIPDDIKIHGKSVLRHRLILQPDAEIEGVTTDEVVEAVLRETEVPGMGQRRPAVPSAPPTTSGKPTAPSPVDRPSVREPQGPVSPSTPPWSTSDHHRDNIEPLAPAPSQPSRPAHAPGGSSPSKPAGIDPNTLPPPTRGPFGGHRGGQS
ncbi:MAG: AAA family ATPase, partial [Myxococcota bacterium]